jgi:hypothetical protein
MPWFNQIFGFTELTYAETQMRFRIESDKLHTDTQPSRSFQVGTLTTPNVGELRTQVGALAPLTGTRLTLRTISADAYALHTWPEAHGALIQVASQFNLLEMPGPNTTPEDGITEYRHDHTQGPACAMACAPAAVFPNYLVSVDGQTGQIQTRQINTLRDLDRAIGIPVFECRTAMQCSTLKPFRRSASTFKASTRTGVICCANSCALVYKAIPKSPRTTHHPSNA